MGNQQELDKDKFNINIKDILNKVTSLKKNSYMELDTRATSSYSGIRTNYDNSSLNEEKINSIYSSEEKLYSGNFSTTIINENIPTKFEWKEAAGIVYLVGSFGNWNQRFIMNKVGNTFELILVIKINLYQFPIFISHLF